MRVITTSICASVGNQSWTFTNTQAIAAPTNTPPRILGGEEAVDGRREVLSYCADSNTYQEYY